MARIGLKYPVYAKYNVDESNSKVTYTNGTNIGKAIKADISINAPDNKFYADDEVAERVKEFIDGTINIETSDLSPENYVTLLGHSKSGTDAADEIISKGTDAPIYVGFGFYGRKIVNNKQSYRAIWFTKVIFAEPNENFETKGESITFGSHTLEGSIETDVNGVYKYEQTFDEEADARTWLNTKAGISATTTE